MAVKRTNTTLRSGFSSEFLPFEIVFNETPGSDAIRKHIEDYALVWNQSRLSDNARLADILSHVLAAGFFPIEARGICGTFKMRICYEKGETPTYITYKRNSPSFSILIWNAIEESKKKGYRPYIPFSSVTKSSAVEHKALCLALRSLGFRRFLFEQERQSQIVRFCREPDLKEQYSPEFMTTREQRNEEKFSMYRDRFIEPVKDIHKAIQISYDEKLNKGAISTEEHGRIQTILSKRKLIEAALETLPTITNLTTHFEGDRTALHICDIDQFYFVSGVMSKRQSPRFATFSLGRKDAWRDFPLLQTRHTFYRLHNYMRWGRFLREVLQEEHHKALHRQIGYLLCNHTKDERHQALVWNGPASYFLSAVLGNFKICKEVEYTNRIQVRSSIKLLWKLGTHIMVIRSAYPIPIEDVRDLLYNDWTIDIDGKPNTICFQKPRILFVLDRVNPETFIKEGYDCSDAISALSFSEEKEIPELAERIWGLPVLRGRYITGNLTPEDQGCIDAYMFHAVSKYIASGFVQKKK